MRLSFWCLAGCGVLLLSLSGASAQTPAAEYLKRYNEARERLGAATAQTEGALEVRGVIQGRVDSDERVTLTIYSESTDASYLFAATGELPGFNAGARVRVLGRGYAVPRTVVQLLAIIPDVDLPAQAAPETPATAVYAPPTRVIQFDPVGEASPSPTPVPAQAKPRVAQTAPQPKAPTAPKPPKWREPGASSPAPKAPARPAPQAQLASRGWDDYIARYQQAIRWFNPRLSSTQSEVIARSILAYSSHYRIDPRLVVAIIAVESNFSPTATSHKGAMGLGQLMPGTAAGLGVRDAYDPVENIEGAVRLLRGHLKQHSGKPFWEQLSLALASYNAGSGAVKKYGGVPPYRETQRYIDKVGRLYAHLCGQRAQ